MARRYEKRVIRLAKWTHNFLLEYSLEFENQQVGDLGAAELVMFLDTNLPDYELDVSPRVENMIQEGRGCSPDGDVIIGD